MQTLEIFESELLSSRKVMSTKSRHLRGCLDTNFNTRVRKICTANNGDSRCEHSSRHDETIDILTIAQFVVYQEIWCAPYPQYIVKVLRWGTKNLDFPAQIIVFFVFLFQLVIRIAFVYSFEGGQDFFFFFSVLFHENVGRIFLETTIYAGLSKKKWTPFESFGCTLRERELHTI